VENSLLIFQDGKATGDYHGQMNARNFEFWVNTQLLPSLPEKSVTVMDNAPYHSIQENKPPTRNSVKAEMISWLEKNNVPFAVEMRKTELFQLVARHKRPEKNFRIDQVLKFHSRDVLRLPPYMCDLGPIELAWAKVKRLIREKNVAGEMSLSVLKDFGNRILGKGWVIGGHHR
jgi:transposase